MVFEGMSPGQLASLLLDPRANGGKTPEQILEHVEEDSLVKGGWDPGDGRAKPPISHEEFVARMKEWVATGAVAPE
jgi:hypothetical protein